MDYFNKILILQTYHNKYKENNDDNNADKTLSQIKNLHGKIIEHILDLKESKEHNKLELLSDLECLNYKIINIINNCSLDTNNSKKNTIINLKEENSDENNNLKKENSDDKKSTRKLHKHLSSLILFYAEWCGHCKILMPIWDALYDKIPEDKLNILKVSCVEKEKMCKSIKYIEGYPTIIFVDSKNNKVKLYEGERTIENIISFINENVGTKLIKI